jgi:hypothetical protein
MICAECVFASTAKDICMICITCVLLCGFGLCFVFWFFFALNCILTPFLMTIAVQIDREWYQAPGFVNQPFQSRSAVPKSISGFLAKEGRGAWRIGGLLCKGPAALLSQKSADGLWNSWSTLKWLIDETRGLVSLPINLYSNRHEERGQYTIQCKKKPEYKTKPKATQKYTSNTNHAYIFGSTCEYTFCTYHCIISVSPNKEKIRRSGVWGTIYYNIIQYNLS